MSVRENEEARLVKKEERGEMGQAVVKGTGGGGVGGKPGGPGCQGRGAELLADLEK